MALDSSVAPKERVNIRYRPATGDAKEDVELPFKMVVLGDFTGRPDDTPLEARDRIQVDRDNFADVMKAQKLSLDLRVDNKLAETPDAGPLDVSLRFDDIRSFEPDQLVQNVPELRKLLEVRQALMALKGPLGNVPAFRRAMQSLVTDAGAREKLVGELTKHD